MVQPEGAGRAVRADADTLEVAPPGADPLFPEDPGVEEAEVGEADASYGFPRAEGGRSESGVLRARDRRWRPDREAPPAPARRAGRRRPGAAFQGQGGAPGAPPRQGPGRPFGAPGGGQQGRRPGGAGGGQWRDRRPEGDWRGGSGARGGAPSGRARGARARGARVRAARAGAADSAARATTIVAPAARATPVAEVAVATTARARAGRGGHGGYERDRGGYGRERESYDRSEPERGNERGAGYRSEYDSSGPRPTSGFRALGKSPRTCSVCRSRPAGATAAGASVGAGRRRWAATATAPVAGATAARATVPWAAPRHSVAGDTRAGMPTPTAGPGMPPARAAVAPVAQRQPPQRGLERRRSGGGGGGGTGPRRRRRRGASGGSGGSGSGGSGAGRSFEGGERVARRVGPVRTAGARPGRCVPPAVRRGRRPAVRRAG